MENTSKAGNCCRQLCLALTLLILAVACSPVVGTGRSQLNLVNDNELNQTASLQYRDLIKEGPLSTNKKDLDLVKRVGKRISKAAEDFLKENGRGQEVASYKWEFNVINSDEANAFCMPGGKVAFYSGILPLCQDETGVATVMGHEVAHAIAHHGNERVSQQMMANVGAQLLSVGLQIGGASALTGDLVMNAYGLGSQFGVLLPFSRTHEAEADRIGLTIMAMAGYNPREALGFWERMSASSNSNVPFFLSTHPTDKQRIGNINKYLPEAETKYQSAEKTTKSPSKKKKKKVQ